MHGKHTQMLSLERSSEVKREAVVKPFPHLDEVRNQLYIHGVRSLNDEELLVLLIRHGDANHNVLSIAHHVLNTGAGGLNGIAQYNPWELAAMPGMNRNKASALCAAIELGKRRASSDPRCRQLISSSANAYELLKSTMLDLPHEEFWLVLLDRGQRLIGIERLSSGGMTGTVADPKMIFKTALDRRACGMILAHNHPSGQLRPSTEDISLTRKIVEGSKLLDIAINDHLIMANEGYYSFADQGQLH